MNGTFNGQILVDKLSKLNSSQQSIERAEEKLFPYCMVRISFQIRRGRILGPEKKTRLKNRDNHLDRATDRHNQDLDRWLDQALSHWCIFHRKNAKQVVETWGRQFHCAPKSQRISFLYLANDILQNSRRKGLEFVNEFWKVLPDALKNVVESGDEFGRSAALRLIDIWEDRKVFGSRGQPLKDEIFGRKISNLSPNSKIPVENNKNEVVGSELQKLISSYQRVYESPVDETIVLSKCQHAIGSIEQVEKEMAGKPVRGDMNESQIRELERHHMILRECVEELKMAEASRASLVSNLRGAIEEQESKLEQVRKCLQSSQIRLQQAGSICQRLAAASNGQLAKGTNVFSDPPHSSIQEAESISTLAAGQLEDSRKMAAASMAAKLTASATSAEMLSYVLSSLAAEGKEEASNDGKRPRLETNLPPAYVPQQPPLPPLPPPPPPPPLPPMPPPPQYVHVSSMAGSPQYGYGTMPLQRPQGVSMSSNVSLPPPPPPFMGYTQQSLPPPPPPQPASRQ